MSPMPKPRPPHLQRRITRHGKVTWYVRVARGPLIRIKAAWGTPEFDAAYRAALVGERPEAARGPAKDTLAWLVNLHRQSRSWLDLSSATRRQRENIMSHILKTAANEPISAIDKQAIIEGRDRRAATPYQARHFVDSMRAMFIWAVEANLVPSDPTAGIKVKKPKTKGFPVWTDDDISQFEARWPRGTRERVMFDVFLYTGLRRGDAARLGRQHVREGVIEIDTEKTGMRVTIPMLAPLKATLDAGPTGDLAFIATRSGNPLVKESLGNYFADACRAAGIKKSAHGLRKAAATHAADQGATVSELEAIFGWAGGQMAALYTRSANRKALAKGAMSKLDREAERRTSMLPPEQKVVASKQIHK
jgi:integrase